MLTERLTLALPRHALVLHLLGLVTSCYAHIWFDGVEWCTYLLHDEGNHSKCGNT